ncbi:MAG: cytochrome c peroxidase [Flavobacteriales bacterium]|jgi:cytochrome c peroxidase
MQKAHFIWFLFIIVGALGVISFTTQVEAPQKWAMHEVQFPADNPFSEESVTLGSALFGEQLFSEDTTISCQSCHMPHMGMTDQLKVGEGVFRRPVTRNTPTLLNIGLHPYFMKDGKFASLEDQVLGPIKDHREFNMDEDELLMRLQSLPYLDELSQEAYGADLTIDIIQKSLANLQRVLVSDDSPFDAFMLGNLEAISASAQNGYQLFTSDKLNCNKCHSGFDFADYSFQNNGTYAQYLDSGRAIVTKQTADIGKFKVPTLRNLAVTFPYMHDGSFQTLEEVIHHYEQGGQASSNKSPYITGFTLTDVEREDLLAFLGALTEKRFLEEE